MERENVMIVIIFVAFLVIAIVCCIYLYWNDKKMYQEVYQMLDDILDGKPIVQSDIKEGRISALANKGKRVQEKMNLEIANAMEEKEQVKGLISNMSHQLKTPLANVMMYEEILAKEDFQSENYYKFLNKMQVQSEKIEWILQSLFKMVKLEQNVISFEADNLPIKDTVLDAVNIVYGKADKKNIEIEVEAYSDCVLYHNRKWTTEVFANLLENAIKYTKTGGKIRIKVNPYEMYTSISFIDNGIGIKTEELTEVCKRFYRSSDVANVEGSGIGLYLSKMILEKEKGYLNITSEHGVGSNFSVFLQNCKK
ncbi:sensor histidine kinase [Clostridium oryzae]|uniref:histidine kinase n=1 Tax=Clostridium oryzae TaxID=1450648 RepID=A0A1V4INL0_9CLOT|nr:HAMP domain-containing sensor histidine kinase [Clostridium oryzae]OPJ61439.1 alkaline phosphatase synthesis sensor protein PhoR [Clostridium oryzae]